MRLRSLQRTLAVRYGLTVLVTMLAFAWWAYAGVDAALEQQLDRELRSDAGLMVDVIAKGESLARHRGSADLPGFVAEVNRLVVARDSSGRALDSNSPLASDLPFDAVGFAAARAGAPALATREFRGTHIRSIYTSVPRAGAAAPGQAVVVQVAASIEPLQRVSRGILFRLLLTGLLGALATALGAAWLARRSLEPVAEIAAQARTVTARGGERRITAHADVLELRDLIQVLNDMLARLEQAIGQQRRIISDVGHELRTPITVMRGEIEVALRTDRAPERYKTLLRSVLEEVDRLALMGDELITLSRYDSEELALHPVTFDLRDVVSSAVGALRRRSPAVPVELRLPATELRLRADPRLLTLALDHVLDNAVRHTPAGTAIRVSAEGDSSQAAFSVEDAGPGVPEELLSQLAEPFFRADRARARGGVGLGLTLVTSIVALHDGILVPSRSPLGGLQVRVSVPRRVPAATPTVNVRP
jgi:two-component system heavy metal sensor histidine kinase CusS